MAMQPSFLCQVNKEITRMGAGTSGFISYVLLMTIHHSVFHWYHSWGCLHPMVWKFQLKGPGHGAPVSWGASVLFFSASRGPPRILCLQKDNFVLTAATWFWADASRSSQAFEGLVPGSVTSTIFHWLKPITGHPRFQGSRNRVHF